VQADLSSLFVPPLLQRLLVGCWVLITINTLIFGFVQWIPTFFLQQGLTISRSFDYILVLAVASPLGCAVGAFCADFIGRRWSIIGGSVATILLGSLYATFTAATSPAVILSVGFALILAIYIQVAILFGVYTPELFPTEVRLRGNGICNTMGRAAQIVVPFIVLYLATNYKVPGVMAFMVGLVVIQIAAVYFWGVEPNQRPLEELESSAEGPAGGAPRPIKV
jgi:putative MFS transporter